MICIPGALVALALFVCAPAATAATEPGDAGDLPATAQDLSDEGVRRIDGSFESGSDIDMYRLCLSGGGSFSASTVGGTTLDTQLFLFDAGGRGVYANDDLDDLRQSRLPDGHPLTPRGPGDYLLAVGPYNVDPFSSTGPIFPVSTDVVGPAPPGGAHPVTGWGGRMGGTGAYSIFLTGADCAAPDTTPPTVDLRSPLDGAVYLLDEEVEADYSCADEEGGSGLVSCAGDVPDGAPVDTSAVGPHEFRVDAADAAGNTATAAGAFRVVYDFDGFLSPVRNRPAVNEWVPGRPVPIRFELGGDQGLDVIEDGWPQVAEVGCELGEEPEAGVPAKHPRWFRELVYRKRKERYVYRWKTDPRWAGSCRQFILKLRDGTVKRADFRFGRGRRDKDG